MPIALWVAYASFNTTLNAYYQDGSTIWDTTLFAANIWRSGWNLQLPSVYDNLPYLAFHISPILYIPAFFSYFFSGNFITYYALVYSLIYAGFIFLIYVHLLGLAAGEWGIALAAFGAQAFYLSQPLVNGSWEMRIDYVAIPFMLMALRAWQAQKYRWCLFWFMCTASVHEIMALFFMPSFVLLAASQLFPRRKHAASDWRTPLRWAVIIVAVSVVYSAAAILVQKRFFPGWNIVGIAYLSPGSDPFAHLTKPVLLARLDAIYHQPGLWLPLLVLIAAGIALRDMPLLAGAIGFIPYLVMILCAKHEMFGEWAGYKSFPLLIALLWPSIIALERTGFGRKRLIALQLIVLACGLSYLTSERMRILAHIWLPQPLAHNAALYDAFGDNDLNDELRYSTSVRASDGILSLYPYRFPNSSRSGITGMPWEIIYGADTLIWFEGDRDQPIIMRALAQGHYTVTAVEGTQIRIAHKAGSSIMRIAP